MVNRAVIEEILEDFFTTYHMNKAYMPFFAELSRRIWLAAEGWNDAIDGEINE